MVKLVRFWFGRTRRRTRKFGRSLVNQLALKVRSEKSGLTFVLIKYRTLDIGPYKMCDYVWWDCFNFKIQIYFNYTFIEVHDATKSFFEVSIQYVLETDFSIFNGRPCNRLTKNFDYRNFQFISIINSKSSTDNSNRQ